MSHSTVLTPDQVKEKLRQQGKTITQWAEEHGYDREKVYRVLNGQLKAHYGRAHQIAVELGLKASNAQPSTARTSRNTQSRAAA